MNEWKLLPDWKALQCSTAFEPWEFALARGLAVLLHLFSEPNAPALQFVATPSRDRMPIWIISLASREAYLRTSTRASFEDNLLVHNISVGAIVFVVIFGVVFKLSDGATRSLEFVCDLLAIITGRAMNHEPKEWLTFVWTEWRRIWFILETPDFTVHEGCEYTFALQLPINLDENCKRHRIWKLCVVVAPLWTLSRSGHNPLLDEDIVVAGAIGITRRAGYLLGRGGYGHLHQKEEAHARHL